MANTRRKGAIMQLKSTIDTTHRPPIFRACWLYTLTTEGVRDLEAAATHFPSLGIDIG